MSDDQEGRECVNVFLVPAYPGSPGQSAVKRLWVCATVRENQQCMKLKLFIKQCKQLSCSYKSVLVKGQWCHAAGQVIESLKSQWPCCICVLPTIIYLPYYISGWTCTAFSVAGPMAWNSLPDSIGDPTNSTDCFGRLLNTYLLRDTSALSTWGSWR